ncbi:MULTISPECIES: phosphoribosylglycinamide formyltransferase [Campylobacter]|uniref:Phosphoribosylglycinamide formyltransferase n=1 Tax=Campylobacter porcelli TaxID=1660073 RepID=A0ABU7M3M2_9BACT|nr:MULTISPECIES: phosphoribosylglycinamide formyltransferase [unclassified Campylobacter]MCR8678806.1 phosphoribosylglycinamide formyltransferase [Campylobacter sp. RM19072]MCR8696861.1 phosphoribosylglycinamide formyltransferase [Campylobacter sp. RM19073]MEE3744169.1 phosphoribosylglycinamide formyltransferase [Campylobacter sp. CX2-4855-23]
MVVKNIAVLFSGSGSNLQAILEKIHNKIFNGVKIKVALLICNNPNAKGIKRAKKFGLETIVINHRDYDSREEFDQALVDEIKKHDIDLSVLAGFMRILTPVFTDNIKAINLHPSILPLFKGANAINESYNSDMKIGGVSVHWVSSQLDSGEIIAQKSFARKHKSLKEWEEKIHKIEHKLLPKTIIEILAKGK